jgi:lipoate-protein ligase A
MCIDNYLLHSVNAPDTAVFRFYGWQPACISLGFHQAMSVINTERLKKDNYDIVRRPTGGRAIFHAEELTYSIIMPNHIMNHQTLYSVTHQIIATALHKLGFLVKLTSGNANLPKIKQSASDFPCFARSAATEIQYDGKKVVGSAQKLLKHVTLQHGSILIGPAHKRLCDYLQVDGGAQEKIRQNLTAKTISLSEIKPTSVSPVKIMTNIVTELESVATNSVNFKELTPEEITGAKKYEIQI